MLKEVHFRLGLSVVPIKKIIEGEKVIINTIVLVGGGVEAGLAYSNR